MELIFLYSYFCINKKKRRKKKTVIGLILMNQPVCVFVYLHAKYRFNLFPKFYIPLSWFSDHPKSHLNTYY